MARRVVPDTQREAFISLTNTAKDNLYLKILASIKKIHFANDTFGNPKLQGACISEISKDSGIATSTVSARLNELKKVEYFEFNNNKFTLELHCKRASNVTLIRSECYRISKYKPNPEVGIQGELF